MLHTKVADQSSITLSNRLSAAGLSFIPQTLVRRERWPGGYHVKVNPLVQSGQYIRADQPVMQVEQASSLSSNDDIGSHNNALETEEGVETPLKASFASQAGSALGAPATHTGGSNNKETLPAGLRGKVVEITLRGGVVIESHAALVTGALGVGQQVAGVLTMWQDTGTARPQSFIPPGALLVIPGPLNFALLRQAVISGVNGVIASSITMRDLEGFLHTDLFQLIDSVNIDVAQMYLPPLTLLLTEGPGTFAMPQQTIQLLRKYQGLVALLTGTTLVRQRVFPELLISLPEEEVQRHWHPTSLEMALSVGVAVRICSDEYEGACGKIDYLFEHQQAFPSGVHATAARVRLEAGKQVMVPLEMLERLG